MTISRDDLKARLTDAGLPDEVIDGLVDALPDDELVRMKDMDQEQLTTALQAAIMKAADTDEAEDEDESSDSESDDEDEEDGDDAQLKDVMVAWADEIAERVAAAVVSQNMEVDVPALGEIMTELSAVKDSISEMVATIKDLSAQLKDALDSEDSFLANAVGNLSPAQRARLRTSLSEAQTAARVSAFKDAQNRGNGQPGAQDDEGDGAVIMDAQGKVYPSLSAFSAGKPSD